MLKYIVQNDDYRCPSCGSLVEWEPDCPGYPGYDHVGKRNTTMVCYPACGNADYFQCTSKTCAWWYREPNRRGDGYKFNVGVVAIGEKPDWFDAATAWRMSIEEEDDDDDEDIGATGVYIP